MTRRVDGDGDGDGEGEREAVNVTSHSQKINNTLNCDGRDSVRYIDASVESN